MQEYTSLKGPQRSELPDLTSEIVHGGSADESVLPLLNL